MQSGLFSLYEQTSPVNYNIDLTIEPDSNVTSYSYTIYKDEKPYKVNSVSSNEITSITLKETGKYEIVVSEIINYKMVEVRSGIYIIDKEAPVIEVDNLIVNLNRDSSLRSE